MTIDRIVEIGFSIIVGIWILNMMSSCLLDIDFIEIIKSLFKDKK